MRFFQNAKDWKAGKTERKVGLPKFKSKKNEQSYTTFNVTDNIKIDFGRREIKLPKITSWIRYTDPRRFASPIRHTTV